MKKYLCNTEKLVADSSVFNFSLSLLYTVLKFSKEVSSDFDISARISFLSLIKIFYIKSCFFLKGITDIMPINTCCSLFY